MRMKIDANTTALKDKLYPIVKEAFDKPSTRNAYKEVINSFMTTRSDDLYDSLPCDRLVCNESTMDELFPKIKIDKKTVTDIMLQTYFGTIDHFKPLCAKHEFTLLQVCIIRYFVLNNMPKDAELATIYLSFSGKFYPSLHYRSYPIAPAKHVREDVGNNVLTSKYDLKTYGNVIGAIKSVGKTWLDAYKSKFKSFTDEDVV